MLWFDIFSSCRLPPKSEGPVKLTSSQRKALAARLAERILQEEHDPMQAWINPRILSKVGSQVQSYLQVINLSELVVDECQVVTETDLGFH